MFRADQKNHQPRKQQHNHRAQRRGQVGIHLLQTQFCQYGRHTRKQSGTKRE